MGERRMPMKERLELAEVKFLSLMLLMTFKEEDRKELRSLSKQLVEEEFPEFPEAAALVTMHLTNLIGVSLKASLLEYGKFSEETNKISSQVLMILSSVGLAACEVSKERGRVR